MAETEVSITLLVYNPAFLNGCFLLEQKFYLNPEKSIFKIFPIVCYIMNKPAFLTPSMALNPLSSCLHAQSTRITGVCSSPGLHSAGDLKKKTGPCAC